jgi:D-3-phosphoglycerate dehydrogenase
MPNFKVAVQKREWSPFSKDGYQYEREALDSIGAEIVEIDAATEEEFVEGAREADGLLAVGRRMTANIIKGLENVKVIGLSSVGADTVDVEAATAAGIVVTNVPDVFVEEVADHTLALALAGARKLKLMDRLMREDDWRSARSHYDEVPRLWGQTFGLIAFGNIARAVARRCQPFGLRVIAFDPYVSELEMTGEGVEPLGFYEMLAQSDFVSMHTPLNTETKHMMSTKQFEAMKTTAIFINNGRGPTVDEAALTNALQTNQIAGAALDVFEVEPTPADNPLLAMDNVIATPHVASASSRMLPETRRRTGREIASVLQGRWPRSAINPEVLSHAGLERWQPYPMSRGPNR